jgi:hypothetical protein
VRTHAYCVVSPLSSFGNTYSDATTPPSVTFIMTQCASLTIVHPDCKVIQPLQAEHHSNCKEDERRIQMNLKKIFSSCCKKKDQPASKPAETPKK